MKSSGVRKAPPLGLLLGSPDPLPAEVPGAQTLQDSLSGSATVSSGCSQNTGRKACSPLISPEECTGSSCDHSFCHKSPQGPNGLSPQEGHRPAPRCPSAGRRAPGTLPTATRRGEPHSSGRGPPVLQERNWERPWGRGSPAPALRQGQVCCGPSPTSDRSRVFTEHV